MSNMLVIAAVAFAFVPGILRAQTPRADGTLLRAGTDTLVIYSIKGKDTVATGTAIDRLELASVAGQAVWIRTYVGDDRLLGVTHDSNTDRQADLAPVSLRSRSSTSGFAAIEFMAGVAKGWRPAMSGDSTPVSVMLVPGTINASSFDLFVRASPLVERYQLSIPGYIGATGTVATLTAKVIGTELVAGIPCWKVDANFAGGAVTFWITKVGRQMQQQLLVFGPGLSMLLRRVGHP